MPRSTRGLRSNSGAACALVALLLGCPAALIEEPAPPAESPCETTWGASPASGRVYVDAAADEGGDGSAEAPFAALL